MYDYVGQTETTLGAVHNFRHIRERTKRTLFLDPLPPCRERTLKNVETNISFPSQARIAATDKAYYKDGTYGHVFSCDFAKNSCFNFNILHLLKKRTL